MPGEGNQDIRLPYKLRASPGVTISSLPSQRLPAEAERGFRIAEALSK
jgi:hypothetical protein